MLTRNGEHRCRHRVPARLPRLVQSGRHRQQRPGRRDRRLDAERADGRLHLRESQKVRRSRVRRGAAAISRRADRAERARAASGASSWDEAIELIATRLLEVREQLGRRSHPAVFLRRIEWPAHAGHARRRALPPVRHVAPRAHGVRGADRRGRAGALRQDAVGHLRGLSGRAAHRPLGRQPVDVGHPSRAVRARGAEIGRAAHRHRSAFDAAREAGRSPPGAEARHRRRDRACDPSLPVRGRVRRHAVSRRAHEGRRTAARAGGGMDVRARGRDLRRA